ncbi:MAG: hypothetical protein Q8P57_03240 [Candidatus Pacearchaeota archaeon]|nr:hypothetical protein [Candidatus Pacearchaeota archaeon]
MNSETRIRYQIGIETGISHDYFSVLYGVLTMAESNEFRNRGQGVNFQEMHDSILRTRGELRIPEYKEHVGSLISRFGEDDLSLFVNEKTRWRIEKLNEITKRLNEELQSLPQCLDVGVIRRIVYLGAIIIHGESSRERLEANLGINFE